MRRQRGNAHGKTGTTLRYTDPAGRRTTVFPDGTSEFGLKVERDTARQVVRGSGPLPALAAIARQRRARAT